jgi:hypothetical protein
MGDLTQKHEIIFIKRHSNLRQVSLVRIKRSRLPMSFRACQAKRFCDRDSRTCQFLSGSGKKPGLVIERFYHKTHRRISFNLYLKILFPEHGISVKKPSENRFDSNLSLDPRIYGAGY